MMRTTVNLDPELLAEVVEETGERDRGRAINRAMAEYVERKKIDRLLAMRGKLKLDIDWEKWEEEEMELEKEHAKDRKW